MSTNQGGWGDRHDDDDDDVYVPVGAGDDFRPRNVLNSVNNSSSNSSSSSNNSSKNSASVNISRIGFNSSSSTTGDKNSTINNNSSSDVNNSTNGANNSTTGANNNRTAGADNSSTADSLPNLTSISSPPLLSLLTAGRWIRVSIPKAFCPTYLPPTRFIVRLHDADADRKFDLMQTEMNGYYSIVNFTREKKDRRGLIESETLKAGSVFAAYVKDLRNWARVVVKAPHGGSRYCVEL